MAEAFCPYCEKTFPSLDAMGGHFPCPQPPESSVDDPRTRQEWMTPLTVADLQGYFEALVVAGHGDKKVFFHDDDDRRVFVSEVRSPLASDDQYVALLGVVDPE